MFLKHRSISVVDWEILNNPIVNQRSVFLFLEIFGDTGENSFHVFFHTQIRFFAVELISSCFVGVGGSNLEPPFFPAFCILHQSHDYNSTIKLHKGSRLARGGEVVISFAYISTDSPHQQSPDSREEMVKGRNALLEMFGFIYVLQVAHLGDRMDARKFNHLHVTQHFCQLSRLVGNFYCRLGYHITAQLSFSCC